MNLDNKYKVKEKFFVDRFTEEQLEKEFGTLQYHEWFTSDSLGKEKIRIWYRVDIDPITGYKFMNLYDIKIKVEGEKNDILP